MSMRAESSARLTKNQTVNNYLRGLVIARGKADVAIGWAKERDYTIVVDAYKGAVSAMETSTEGAALMSPIATDYSQMVRSRSLLGRIPGFRPALFNARLLEQTGGVRGAWVQEGKPMPVASAAFSNENDVLLPLKCGSITVHSRELARQSEPEFAGIIAADSIEGTADAADAAFLDPTNSGTLGRPASITSTATAIPSTGAGLSAVDADLKAAVAAVSGGGFDSDDCVWIMCGTTATNLALLRGTSGSLAFPTMSNRPRTLAGLPVYVSPFAEDADSPGGRHITLFIPSQVSVAEGGAELKVGTESALQMSTTPADAPAALVSLWPDDLVGVKIVRTLNWKVRRAESVAIITNCAY